MASDGTERCPRCGAHFETRAAILDLGQARGFLDIPAIPPRVSCPGCKYEFHAKGMRYFGFLTPRQVQLGLALFVVAFAIAGLYFLFGQDPTW